MYCHQLIMKGTTQKEPSIGREEWEGRGLGVPCPLPARWPPSTSHSPAQKLSEPQHLEFLRRRQYTGMSGPVIGHWGWDSMPRASPLLQTGGRSKSANPLLIVCSLW